MDTQVLTSEVEVEEFAQRVFSNLSLLKTATVIALHGELGAGKTTFTKAFAKLLGVASPVTSPTFVLMKTYDIGTHEYFKTLVHIDAYRLESSAEASPLRLSELFSDPQNLICIEWAERIANILPKDRLDITFAHTKTEGVREVCMHTQKRSV